MSDLSELIKIGKNIEAQNEEIIRLLKKIAGEDEKTPNSAAVNQMMPYPENPFDFSTLAYDDLDDEEEDVVDVSEVENPHFEESLDIGEVYFMEDFNPFKISIENNELIIDNFDTSNEAGDYHFAEIVANELAKSNRSFDESTVILPESVMGNLPITLEKCIAEGAKKVYGPWKSMMELLNAPEYLQTKLQLDFYKTEEHLIERVFKE
jgi:hypothetical protein